MAKPSALGHLLPAVAGAVCLAVAIAACSHESPVAPAPADGLHVRRVSHGGPGIVRRQPVSGLRQHTAARMPVDRLDVGRMDPILSAPPAGRSRASSRTLWTGQRPRDTVPVTVSWAGGSQSIAVTQSCNVTQTVNLSPEEQEFLVYEPGCSLPWFAPVSVDVPWISQRSRLSENFSNCAVALNTGPERIGLVTTPLGTSRSSSARGTASRRLRRPVRRSTKTEVPAVSQ